MNHPSSYTKADCIVIGVGSMGSAACYYLAKRGYTVIGLEQFGIVHDRGAHGGQTRIIRKAYYEHPNYIPLLQQAYHNWQEIETLSNNQIYFPTGLLYAGPRNHPLIESVKASALAYHIPLEDLSITETNNRFPAFTLPHGSDIVFEPEAGFLRPDEAIRSYIHLAKSKGANILTDVEVTGWKKDGDGVTVTTTHGTYHADRLVITAGPWSANLIPGIKEKLTVTRQVLAWIQPKQPGLFAPEVFPCWFIVEKDREGAYYGFPWLHDPATNMTGIKIAYHHRGTPTEPDKVNRAITREDTEHLQSFIQKYLPIGMGDIHFSKTCLYSYSPDEHFIIDHVPDTEGRVSMAWGFSGHGFKFASAVGEILADLAIDGKTRSPIDFLRADRFDH